VAAGEAGEAGEGVAAVDRRHNPSLQVVAGSAVSKPTQC